MAEEFEMHFESDMEVRSKSGTGSAFCDIVSRRLNRRKFLKGGLVAAMSVSGIGTVLANDQQEKNSPMGLDFKAIKPSKSNSIVLAEGYRHELLVAWGDSLLETYVPIDANMITPAEQLNAFGYNNDYVGYLPLPFGSSSSDHGLLGVNHEYVNPELMFNIGEDVTQVTKEQVEVSLEAVGFSVVEVKLVNNQWKVVQGSKFSRRYTANSPMLITGPASGDDRMKTQTHNDGVTCTGTFSNCSAGKTPWGTVLSGEENFQDNFAYCQYVTDHENRSAKRYGIPSGASSYGWEKYFERFDGRKDPNEPNHFGWVVEIDPYDPNWMPRKRTALGRFRHEAATTHVTSSGQVVMYSGDDARFEYVYKFVSRDKFDSENREANRDLMDEGILYVAKFHSDGKGDWIPLIYGQEPLTPENGFHSQADVVIDCRIAADFVGATKMDRPEDIEVNPVSEKVYVVCTNNVDRGREGKEGATESNPRAMNQHGHIIEIIEGGGKDHSSTEFEWELFMVCGDPADESTYFAGYPKDQLSPISCPDNICFDRFGNLWISTDGQEKSLKLRDGFFAVPVEGERRGQLRQFMASVPGSEVCGPDFTPDGTTAFLAIQHPGEGTLHGDWDQSWPEPGKIHRPGIIAIRAENGAPIGSVEANVVDRRSILENIFSLD